jgi:predicted CoA-substrate-specific enzyme activase
MITAGIDIGTRTAKVVIFDDNRVSAFSIRPINDVLSRLSKQVFKSTLKQAGIRRRQVRRIGVTGYGQRQVKFADRCVTTPLCIASAAHYLDKTVRTVIDVGGLITRVILINESGTVADSVENEKCASGSGRFLEMIADALELPIERIGNESLKALRPLKLSGQCVVFAESEVISHVNADEPAADILAGLHRAIAQRVSSLAGKTGFKPPVAVIGGVACNSGVMYYLEKELAANIKPLPVDPQIVGALGAALLARKQ